MFAQVIGDTFLRGFQGLIPLAPIDGANLAVLLVELQGIHHAQAFLHAPAEGEIVDHLVLNRAIQVDEKQTAIGHRRADENHFLVLRVIIMTRQDVVRLGDRFRLVHHQGI
jgi:hypothetical protein